MSAVIPESHHDIFEAGCYGHAATIRADGLISVNPVCVMFDGEQVRFSTLDSRVKAKNLRLDDRMSLSCPHPDNPVHYLELRGRGVIEPDPDRAFVNAMAKKFMGVDEYPYDSPGDNRVIVRMVIEQVSHPHMPGQ